LAGSGLGEYGFAKLTIREKLVFLSLFLCYSKVRLNVIIFLKTEESYKKDYVDINNI